MDHITQFSESLDRSLQFMQMLETILLQETELLAAKDIDKLEPVLAEKRRLAEALERETAQQKSLVESAGYAFAPEGLSTFLARFDHLASHEQLASRWSSLRDATERCNRMNRHNGRLIERGRRRIDMSLRILRGDDSQSATYDPYGRTTSSKPRSRTLSRA